MDVSALPNVMAPVPGNLKEKIYAEVGPDMVRIEKEIRHLLDSNIPLISVVGRYIMNSGGKRLRPLLMILSSRLCGYTGSDDIPLAVVFELLHAAALLHDDVVDHAEFRRSQPAANTIWGNPAVVLIGDYLYSKSIQMAVRYNDIRILDVLLGATTKMSEGEVLQLINCDNLEVGENDYLAVITNKTAVLISAACQTGAILAGAGSVEENALKAYGHHVGIAFQLVDDTLDFTGEVEELGKPVGNDLQEGRVTLPLIYALQKAKAAERFRLRQLFIADQVRAKDMAEIRSLVLRAGGIEYTNNKACEHSMSAKEALRIFPKGPVKEILDDIADYVICRRT